MSDLPDLPELPDLPDSSELSKLPELDEFTAAVPIGPAPVVLLHGAGQMPTMWQSQVEALGASTKAIAPWIDGLRPGRPREVSLARGAAGLLSTFDLNGIKTARMVAHQLGAMVALQAAVDAPGRIERMVLSGPVVLPGRAAMVIQRAMIRLIPSSQLAAVGATKEDLLRSLEVMAEADFSSRLDQINVPTLVICCEGDQAGRMYANALVARLPQVELVLVPGNSNAPMVAAPQAYNEAMVSFLNQ